MNTTVRGLSPILDGYLDELDAATAHLPADEAYEIRDSIAAHIADATHGASHVDDDDARRIVRDLGPVSSIVPLTQPPAQAPRPVQVPRPAFPSDASLAPPQPPRRMGHAATGCGVAALVLFPLIPVSIVLGLLAIVFGTIALRRQQQRGFAVAGLVLGVIAGIVIPVTLIGLLFSTSESGSSSDSTEVTSYPAKVPYNAP